MAGLGPGYRVFVLGSRATDGGAPLDAQTSHLFAMHDVMGEAARPSEAEQSDQFELLANRQDIFSWVHLEKEAAAVISRREGFRNSHHRSEASTWRSTALGCRMISFVEPYAGSRRRLIPFRRTPRSQLPRWDLLMNAWPRVPQESPPACECWAVAHPALSTVRELSSQALSLGGDGHDVVERPTLRLQRVCVEYLEQRRAAVISEVPTSLASLHVAEEGGRRGGLESGPISRVRSRDAHGARGIACLLVTASFRMQSTLPSSISVVPKSAAF